MENEGYIFSMDDFYKKYGNILDNFIVSISVRHGYSDDLPYAVHVCGNNRENDLECYWDWVRGGIRNQDVDIVVRLYNKKSFLDESTSLSENDCSEIIQKLKVDTSYKFIKVSRVSYDSHDSRGIGIFLNIAQKEHFSDYKIKSLPKIDIHRFILDNFDSNYESHINITCNLSKIIPVNHQNYSLNYEYENDNPCIDIYLRNFRDCEEYDPEKIIQKAKYIEYFRKLKNNLKNLNLSLDDNDYPYSEDLDEIHFNIIH
jgi:hypothetical protein